MILAGRLSSGARRAIEAAYNEALGKGPVVQPYTPADKSAAHLATPSLLCPDVGLVKYDAIPQAQCESAVHGLARAAAAKTSPGTRATLHKLVVRETPSMPSGCVVRLDDWTPFWNTRVSWPVQPFPPPVSLFRTRITACYAYRVGQALTAFSYQDFHMLLLTRGIEIGPKMILAEY